MKVNNITKETLHQVSSAGLIGCLTARVSANSLMEQPFVTGALQLVQDATAISALLFPSLGILYAGYYWWRRSAAEPQEKPQWRDRAVDAASVGIVIGLISALVSVVTSYVT